MKNKDFDYKNKLKYLDKNLCQLEAEIMEYR